MRNSEVAAALSRIVVRAAWNSISALPDTSRERFLVQRVERRVTTQELRYVMHAEV